MTTAKLPPTWLSDKNHPAVRGDVTVRAREGGAGRWTPRDAPRSSVSRSCRQKDQVLLISNWAGGSLR